MNQRRFIIIGLTALTAALVGLNLLSYTQRPSVRDSEEKPNRSSYNGASSGTLALFKLLNETGRPAIRWEKPISEIATPRTEPIRTFVVVGPLKRSFDREEADSLYRWVAAGGRLVVMDRIIDWELRELGEGWELVSSAVYWENPKLEMGEDVIGDVARPTQPAALTSGVNSVQTSKRMQRMEVLFTGSDERARGISTDGPVSLMEAGGRILLVEARLGAGSVAYVADSYIVSNGAVAKLDNARLAVNLLGDGDGLVAFDEYHHGYRYDGNSLIAYFAKTPALAMILQAMLVATLFLLARSVRFGRAIPEKKRRRTSKLEYVSAMAELQRRTAAYDVAVENAYNDFMLRCRRLLGCDSSVSAGEIARMVAERTGDEVPEVAALFKRCEDVAQGGRIREGESLRLVRRLRGIEKALRL